MSTRWFARHPNALPGTQQTFWRLHGTARTTEDATALYYHWLWRAHDANTGQEDPYDAPASNVKEKDRVGMLLTTSGNETLNTPLPRFNRQEKPSKALSPHF
eukprot:1869834-Amphidinium_carterae.1